jgi:hypothetical protein
MTQETRVSDVEDDVAVINLPGTTSGRHPLTCTGCGEGAGTGPGLRMMEPGQMLKELGLLGDVGALGVG